MKPAFKKDGTGTAGNASILSDGAAAVTVMARETAEALGCDIIAAIGAQASYAIDMNYVLVAPIWAIPKCLKKEATFMPGSVFMFDYFLHHLSTVSVVPATFRSAIQFLCSPTDCCPIFVDAPFGSDYSGTYCTCEQGMFWYDQLEAQLFLYHPC